MSLSHYLIPGRHTTTDLRCGYTPDDVASRLSSWNEDSIRFCKALASQNDLTIWFRYYNRQLMPKIYLIDNETSKQLKKFSSMLTSFAERDFLAFSQPCKAFAINTNRNEEVITVINRLEIIDGEITTDYTPHSYRVELRRNSKQDRDKPCSFNIVSTLASKTLVRPLTVGALHSQSILTSLYTPATDCSTAGSLFFSAFIDAFSDRPLVKDVVRDYVDPKSMPPSLQGATLSNLITAPDKRTLTEKMMRCKLPPCANKIALPLLIGAAALSPRLDRRGKVFYWQQVLDENRRARNNYDDSRIDNPDNLYLTHAFAYNNLNYWRDEIRACMIGEYILYQKAFDAIPQSDHDDFEQILRDLNSMLKERRRTLPWRCTSPKRLTEMHDELAREFHQQRYGAWHVDENSRFNDVSSILEQHGWQRLTSDEALRAEGKRQHNCIGAYVPSAKQDKCALFTGVFDNTRHSLEIAHSPRQGMYVKQIYGPCNVSTNKQARQAANAALASYNKTKGTLQ